MRRSVKLRLLLVLSLGLALGAPVGRAPAGPAHYDKDAKAYTFTYTFALLPGGGGDPQLGQVQTPTADQENVVKSLVGQVSDVLSTVTGGRAKISSANYIDNIKDADLVVSLTGAPASPGFANVHATEGQPGQVVLYYESLVPKIKEDVVLTAAHELCHYIFGLADEYVEAGFFPQGCPVRQGSACLMDNYYSQGGRGFMGRFCNRSDHDHEPKQQASCQEIVDKFFNDLGVTNGDQAGAVAGANLPTATTNPRKEIIAMAIGKVRAKRLDDLAQNKVGSSLLSFARQTLAALIDDFNRDNADPLLMTASQIAQAVKGIVDAGKVVPLEKPAELEPRIFDAIKAEAQRLGDQVKDKKSETSRVTSIRSGLRSFIQELFRSKRLDRKTLSAPQQTALVDRLARDAARDPSLKATDRLVGLTNASVELDLAMAEDIITALDELNVPGTRTRLDWLAGLRSRLSKDYSIPGRTFARFGTKRTRLITPDANDENAYVLTQGGVYPYASVRDRSVVEFSRLINRSGKVQLVSPARTAGGDFAPLAARIERPFSEIPPEDPAARPTTGINLPEVIANTIEQLQRNRLENIAVLIPPSGLGDLGTQIPLLRKQVPADVDVRLDMVLVGPAPLSTEGRNLVADRRGSVLTVTDIDEIGAIAQRLKNEQTGGNWVIVPQQGSIPLGQRPALAPRQGTALVKAALQEVKKPNQISSILKETRDQLQKVLKPGVAETTQRRVSEAIDNAQVILNSLNALNQLAGSDLRLMSWGDGSGVPTSGNNLVIVGIDNNGLLHVRIFDAGGDRVTDTDETKLPGTQAGAISTLKQQLPGLLPPHVLTSAEKAQVISEATSIVGQTQLAEGVSKDLDQPGFDLARWKDRPRGVNAQLLLELGPAKERLARSRKLIYLAETSRPSDPAIDPILRKLTEPDQLGENLVNLANLLRAYEQLLEATVVASGDNVPIYARIDRTTLEQARIAVEDARRQQTLGLVTPFPVKPEQDNIVRLARFYAEGNSDFELIIGLTQELPGHTNIASANRFRIKLISDLGVEIADTAKIRFDENTSTPSLLVFRASTPPLRPGWYTPVLTFDKEDFEFLKQAKVNFTFSVGSDRPNIQLISGVVQDPKSTTKGTLKRAEQFAVIEVQVSAPSSVVGARIEGYYQMITSGSGPIDTRGVDFRDDGTDVNGLSKGQNGFDEARHDRAADDGIYTAFIPLTDVQKETEFRVFVQADTTDGKAHYVQLDDPNGDTNLDDADKDKDAASRRPRDKKARMQQDSATKAAEGKVLEFQRATSVHFRVEP